MPGTVSAAMLEEMEGLNRVYPVVELRLGLTVHRFAEKPVASISEGLYLPYIESMSGFIREANDQNFSLSIPNPTFTLFDQDRTIQEAVGGPLKGRVRGSLVECWWRSNHVDADDHHRFFEGVVTDYALTGDRLWSFTCAPSTNLLLGQPKIPYLKDDFPLAPDDFLERPLWIVFGKHSSAGVSGGPLGMVQAVPASIDADGNSLDWVLSYGQIAIQRLWRPISSVMTEDGANWEFYTRRAGEHFYQMARYVGGGTDPLPDDEIRFDCEGLFLESPTSADTTPIENPAQAMRIFLAHFVYGDGDVSPGTTWSDEVNLPIASSLWDVQQIYHADRAHVFAKVIRADETAIDVFNGYCDDYDAVPFFSDEWKIAAITEDEADPNVYLDDRHVKQVLNEALGELAMDNARSRPVSQLIVSHLRVDADGSQAKVATVTDPAASEIVRENFDIEYGPARVIA